MELYIPGPEEPQGDINSFLEPLVDDLLLLWNGVTMNTLDGLPAIVRAALLCAACDIPASRKTCGFVGHNAHRGCSKCLQVFPTHTFGEKPDYSHFNRDEWENSNTTSQQKEIERESCVRYSVLLKLPYFDASRMCIIDPMHNLLLGTAIWHMVLTWKKLGILKDKDFETIQKRVDSFVSPRNSGRQP